MYVYTAANTHTHTHTHTQIAGSVIMMTLLFLTKLFYYMPLCALAAIVIVAALSLVILFV